MRAICLFSRGCLSVKSHIGQVVLSMLVIYSNRPGDIRNFSLFSSSLKNGEPRDVILVEISASQVRLKSFLRYRKLRLFQEVLDPGLLASPQQRRWYALENQFPMHQSDICASLALSRPSEYIGMWPWRFG